MAEEAATEAQAAEPVPAGDITINDTDHSKSEVLQFMRERETAVIATSAGDHLRLRMMHLGVEDDFCIYLATMKNDPKIIQMTNHPSVTIMMNRIPDDITEAEEVEYVGKAVVIRDAEERQRCIDSTAEVSPIVQALIEQDNTEVLDCIKIVPKWVKYRQFSEITQGIPPTVLEFPDNRRVISDWSLLATKLENWWAAVRPQSLAASLVPAVLGAAVAFWQVSALRPWWALLAVIGAVALQAGTNVINDYHDHYSGNDQKNEEYVRPFSGGSRVIQLGLLTPLEILVGGSLMCLLAGGIGAYLAVAGRPWVLALAAVGAASGTMYNKSGWNFIRLGVGEAVIGLNFGLLITLGAYYVQTGTVTLAAVTAAIPLSLLIMSVIFINEFQDAEADARTGKRTWVVRLGREQAAQWFPWFFLAAYGALVLDAAVGSTPWVGLLALLAAPLAWQAVTTARDHHENAVDLAPANGYTAIHHVTFGLLQSLGYIAVAVGQDGLVWTALTGAAFAWFAWYMHRYTDRLRRASVGVKEAMGG